MSDLLDAVHLQKAMNYVRAGSSVEDAMAHAGAEQQYAAELAALDGYLTRLRGQPAHYEKREAPRDDAGGMRDTDGDVVRWLEEHPESNYTDAMKRKPGTDADHEADLRQRRLDWLRENPWCGWNHAKTAVPI